MILLSDSRQQAGKHKNIEAYCQRKGIPMVTRCLAVGDYMLSEDGVNPVTNVSVDTKQNL